MIAEVADNASPIAKLVSGLFSRPFQIGNGIIRLTEASEEEMRRLAQALEEADYGQWAIQAA